MATGIFKRYVEFLFGLPSKPVSSPRTIIEGPFGDPPIWWRVRCDVCGYEYDTEFPADDCPWIEEHHDED